MELNDYLNTYVEYRKKMKALYLAFFLLSWDSSTVAPKGCFEARGENVAVLSQMDYELKTAKEFTEAVNYLYENRSKLDEITSHEIEVLKEYGGIVGFDLSPCVGMLRPRQRFSILINALFSCYCGMKGIKVLPNYRAGDFGTIAMAHFFPNDCSFMIGNHGCNSNEFVSYSEYQLEIILDGSEIDILYVYGSIRRREAEKLVLKYGLEIITFPDRRNRVRNGSKAYRYYTKEHKLHRQEYVCASEGGAA